MCLVYIYIYIYMYARSVKSEIKKEITWDVHLHILCNLWFLKTRLCHYEFTVTVSWCYVITLEWWFHSCWKRFAFDQIQLGAYCTVVWRRFEATFKLRPVIPIFERNEMTECPKNHDNQPQEESHGISNLFSRSRHTVSRIGFSSARVLLPGFLPQGLFFESDYATMSDHFSV